MAKQRHLKFSEEEFDIKTCVQKFGKKLPALIVIREGEEAYLLGDDETEGYCFNTGEVYWLTHIIKIERVIAQDSKKDMLSIPVRYAMNFCFADADGTPYGDSQPLKWMADGRMEEDDLFVAENDKGGMGLLAYKGRYKERFFISNPVFDDLKPHKDPVVIPFHSEITISEVAGFENGTAREFDKYLDDLVKITNRFENALNTEVYSEVEKFSGITENFEGVDYDYVKPSNYVTWGEIKRTREFEHDDAFSSDNSSLPPVDPNNVPDLPKRYIDGKKNPPIAQRKLPALPHGAKGDPTVLQHEEISPSNDEDFEFDETYCRLEDSIDPKLKELHQQHIMPDDDEQFDSADDLEVAPPPPLPPSRGQKIRDVPKPPKSTLKKIIGIVSPQQHPKYSSKSLSRKTSTSSTGSTSSNKSLERSEVNAKARKKSSANQQSLETNQSNTSVQYSMESAISHSPHSSPAVQYLKGQDLKDRKLPTVPPQDGAMSDNISKPKGLTYLKQQVGVADSKQQEEDDDDYIKAVPHPVPPKPKPKPKPRKTSDQEPSTVDDTASTSSKSIDVVVLDSCGKQFKDDENPYKSMKDLPPQLSQLTVENVGNCLKFLHLQKYVDIFQENDINGMLLLNLDDEILTGDLGMSRLDAKKLTLFLEKQWHPT